MEEMWSQGQTIRVQGSLFFQAWFTQLVTQTSFPYPARSNVLVFFLFSRFVHVNKKLSYLLSVRAHLGVLLLFILPMMLWPKIFALVTSAQISSQSHFL